MKYIRPLAVLCLATALTGCGNGVKETLGINRKAPDEYRVVSRPPLSVPPQFNLRPPESGEMPAGVSTEQQAHALIIGGQPGDSGGNFALSDSSAKPLSKSGKTVKAAKAVPTSGSAESQFLANAGADKADPGVRNSLSEEHVAQQDAREEKEDSWWNFWSSPSDKKEPIVNAPKEAERIKTDKAEGKPVTDGATPDAKTSDHGVLGRIFDW